MRDIRSATRCEIGRFGSSYGRPSALAAAGAARAQRAIVMVRRRRAWSMASARYPLPVCASSNDDRARTLWSASMPRRRISVTPADVMREGFEAVRREAKVPERFAPEAEAEAQRAASSAHDAERVDVPFITIDPPGSRDLDQAMHIERSGTGHRVRYAIADVAGFVRPGGALDGATHERGVTVYAPDAKAPLHPPVLSEGGASLLQDEWRPAAVWTLDLDEAGELVSTSVERAQ